MLKKMVLPLMATSGVCLMFLFSLILGGSNPTAARTVFGVGLVGIIAAMVLYQTRHAEPVGRRLALFIILPTPIGFAAAIISGMPNLLLLGLAGSILAGLGSVVWFSYLRLPIRFWGLVSFGKKDLAATSQKLNAIIGAHPDDWQAYRLRADISLNRLHLADAERDARTVVRLRPASHEALYELGRILSVQSRYAEAKQALEAAHKLTPRGPYCYSLGVACYRLAEYDQATELLQRALKKGMPLNLNNMLGYYYLGRSLEALGRGEEARGAYQKMKPYSGQIERYSKSLVDIPDYAEAVTVRAELADIARRLGGGQTGSGKGL